MAEKKSCPIKAGVQTLQDSVSPPPIIKPAATSDNVFVIREKEIPFIQSLPRHVGKAEYIKFLHGEHLTYRERIIANCYRCCTGFVDGFADCQNPLCPLFGVFNFRENTKKRVSRKSQKAAREIPANEPIDPLNREFSGVPKVPERSGKGTAKVVSDG